MVFRLLVEPLVSYLVPRQARSETMDCLLPHSCHNPVQRLLTDRCYQKLGRGSSDQR